MRAQAVLESERLFLREFTAEDAMHLHRLNSHPLVMRYIREPESPDESLETLDTALAYYAANRPLGKLAAHEKSSGEFVGWFTLEHLDNTEKIELGYRMLPQFWRMGYATELASVLLHHGFTHGLPEVWGITHPENLASQRVLQKLGFEARGPAVFYQKNVILFHRANPFA